MIKETIGMFSGPMVNPISKKITSDHITQMIQNDAQETKNDYEFRSSGRKYFLLYAIIVFFGVTYIFIFAEKNTSLYVAILSHAGAIVAGFGAGWGFSKIPDTN